jgi:hypothetical protein
MASLVDDEVLGTKNMMLEIISVLIELEYPASWERLGDQIMKLLKEADTRPKLYIPLKILHRLICCYDRSISKNRETILEPILNSFFPYIENLAS